MPQRVEIRALKITAWIVLVALLGGAVTEFYNVAYGTGTLLGGFSLKWGIAFFGFALAYLLLALATAFMVLYPAKAGILAQSFVARRSRLGILRWLLVALAIILPIGFLQYSPWGVVFSKPYTRLLIWLAETVVLAALFERLSGKVLSWTSIVAGLLVSGASFAAASAFSQVTSYPFALGWSEGNRLWDYSLLYGTSRYTLIAGDMPSAYLEPGRELVGGLPFLMPRLSILGERLWLAMLDVAPYLILGWLVFRPRRGGRGVSWVLAGVWAYLFLNQGPIHTPLVLCAILVALGWGQTLWLAALLVLAAGYFAEVSRYTWIFAPAIWAVMLEFASALPVGNRVLRPAWIRASVTAAAGLFGSLVVPLLLATAHLNPIGQSSAPGVSAGGVSLSGVANAASHQPLLWYRLFPNATFGSGILVGTILAAGPLIALLAWSSIRNWSINGLQRLALILPLLAFLAVGLIISTKIGGGGDLHNLDMFLIGLLFCAGIAYRGAGGDWVRSLPPRSAWVFAAVLLAIAIPAYEPLMQLRPISFANDIRWLVVLTDSPKAKDLGSLPAPEAAATELAKLRRDVQAAQARGPVLFLDQRQLLTFGYLADVPLVSRYEKKRMMDEALSSNEGYFRPFYQDLAAHRFSLIVTDPLRTPIKDSDYGFGEENNAWVKWIAKPVLCYYDEIDTLNNAKVQLLVPHDGAVDCAESLP